MAAHGVCHRGLRARARVRHAKGHGADVAGRHGPRGVREQRQHGLPVAGLRRAARAAGLHHQGFVWVEEEARPAAERREAAADVAADVSRGVGPHSALEELSLRGARVGVEASRAERKGMGRGGALPRQRQVPRVEANVLHHLIYATTEG